VESFIFVVGCIGCIALGIIAIVLVAVFIIDYLRTRRDSNENVLRERVRDLCQEVAIITTERDNLLAVVTQRDESIAELRRIVDSVGYVSCESIGVDTTNLNQV